MSTQNYSDYDLIKQYLGGDKSKIEVLVARHKNQVYSYILLIVKNRNLAEDIFQDTFIKVIKSLNKGKYTDSGKFVSWVMRIAHNLVIDYYRKSKNIKTIAEDDTEQPLFDSLKFSKTNIEEQMINNQAVDDVRFLIKKLPKEQFEIVKMRYYFDMSFKEIAKQTDVSINTALGRMRYAILNLRKLMEQYNMDLVN